MSRRITKRLRILLLGLGLLLTLLAASLGDAAL